MPYHLGNLREALLERAADVIAWEGVDAVSLRGLARDLGVSHAAPRRHFRNRTTLLGELAKMGFQRLMETGRAAAEAAGPDPVARYRAFGRAYVEFAMETPALRDVESGDARRCTPPSKCPRRQAPRRLKTARARRGGSARGTISRPSERRPSDVSPTLSR